MIRILGALLLLASAGCTLGRTDVLATQDNYQLIHMHGARPEPHNRCRIKSTSPTSQGLALTHSGAPETVTAYLFLPLSEAEMAAIPEPGRAAPTRLRLTSGKARLTLPSQSAALFHQFTLTPEQLRALSQGTRLTARAKGSQSHSVELTPIRKLYPAFAACISTQLERPASPFVAILRDRAL